VITGHCECGAVSYQADSEITDFSHCHCSMCRRLHGAAFATFAGVTRDGFSYLSGESELRHYASSASHDRVFCGRCGSNILVSLEADPDMLYLAMGTVDGDPPLPPGYHFYVDSKAPWYTILDSLPQYPGDPDDD